MKLGLPSFLAPKRKYEIDESAWLVKFARSKARTGLIASHRMLLASDYASMAVIQEARKIRAEFRAPKMPAFGITSRKAPGWKESFMSNIESMESQGVPFIDVLKSELPMVIGDAPTIVLLRSVDSKARKQPKRFIKAVLKMFGPSGKRIIMDLNETHDAGRLIRATRPPPEPIESVLDAIRRADAAKLDLLQGSTQAQEGLGSTQKIEA